MKKFYNYGRAMMALEVLEVFDSPPSVRKATAAIREYLEANPVDAEPNEDWEKRLAERLSEAAHGRTDSLIRLLKSGVVQPVPPPSDVSEQSDPVSEPGSNALPPPIAGETPKRTTATSRNVDPGRTRPYSGRNKKLERAARAVVVAAEIPPDNPAAGEPPKRTTAAGRTRPATPEEEEKFKYLVKLSKQTNANTIPLVLKLAGRNGLGKAALERVMGLPVNSLSIYNTRPNKTVDRAFAKQFGWDRHGQTPTDTAAAEGGEG